MVNEMDKETRDRVMAQLLNYSNPSKSANKSGRKVSSKANSVTGTSKNDLMKKLNELIGIDGTF